MMRLKRSKNTEEWIRGCLQKQYLQHFERQRPTFLVNYLLPLAWISRYVLCTCDIIHAAQGCNAVCNRFSQLQKLCRQPGQVWLYLDSFQSQRQLSNSDHNQILLTNHNLGSVITPMFSKVQGFICCFSPSKAYILYFTRGEILSQQMSDLLLKRLHELPSVRSVSCDTLPCTMSLIESPVGILGIELIVMSGRLSKFLVLW